MATKHLASAELRDRIEHLSGEVHTQMILGHLGSCEPSYWTVTPSVHMDSNDGLHGFMFAVLITDGACAVAAAADSLPRYFTQCMQVQRLQRELGDTHASDYNTLKRAYVSLVQHFRALQVEAQVHAPQPSCFVPSITTQA